METVCIILVASTCACSDCVFDVEDTELIVTYVQENILESLSSRRFCHRGRQIAEEVWTDNGVFGAKF